MASEIVLQALDSLEFTRALEKDQREKIANISTYVTFSEGASIFREGDASELVYLIMEGEVTLTTQVPGHGQVVILTLGPGQLLGWSSLFLPQRKTAGARTMKPTKAVAINATQLLSCARPIRSWDMPSCGGWQKSFRIVCGLPEINCWTCLSPSQRQLEGLLEGWKPGLV